MKPAQVHKTQVQNNQRKKKKKHSATKCNKSSAVSAALQHSVSLLYTLACARADSEA